MLMTKRIKKYISVLMLFVMLLSCTTGCGKAQVDTIDDDYRVFYQIFVGSFSDSDGDGIGDIRGIINRMDYLNDGDMNSDDDLGVQGIWLSPIFASPSYHKYDVTSYYRIDPDFGTEEDLAELITLCHERNVKIILDFVPNHTSSSNIWFQRFKLAHQNGDTDNEYYDFYSWATLDTRRTGCSYSKISGTDDYYECNFSTDMPELNYDNETVFNEMVDAAEYWLNLGVDGFRFDAIKYIYYGDTVRSADFWYKYMEALRGVKPDIYTVGECWSADSETLQYITSLNCFNFQMSQAEGYIANAAKGGNIAIYTNYIESYQDKVLAANENAMIIPFISNHDMDRSAGYLTLASKRSMMGANLYILCSGSPFIYYGEEIGLKGSRGSSNTDANRRLAMNWGDGDGVLDPTGATYEKKKQTNGTVKEQQENPDSQLNYYKKLIKIRNKYPEIARGDYESIVTESTTFGGFKITYGDTVTYLFHNTADNDKSFALADIVGDDADNVTLGSYIGQGEVSIKDGTLSIGPLTSVILTTKSGK